MDEDGLIAAWRHLPTAESREKALEALLQEIDPYEWRHVHAITSQRSFQTDIIGRLPIELVIHIFAYLDPSTPYLLQRVSTRWQQVLSSLRVLKPNLSAWYGRARETADADAALCLKMAKDSHAFRYGRKPYRSFELDLLEGISVPLLVDDMLIWTSSSISRSLLVLDMRSWTFKTLTGEGRENVVTPFASEQLVGFTTRPNICYVFDIKEQFARRKFRVENVAMLQAIACRERTVVCAGYTNDTISVYIWEYDTQKGRSFTVGQESGIFSKHLPSCDKTNTLALLPQPWSNSVIVFASPCLDYKQCRKVAGTQEGSWEATIRFSTLKYDGTEVRKSKLQLDHLGSIGLCTCPFVPVNSWGLFRTIILGNRFGDRLESSRSTILHNSEFVNLEFDEHRYEFMDPRIKELKLQPLTPASSWWNTTFFAFLPGKSIRREPFSAAHLAHIGTDESDAWKILAPHPEPYENGYDFARDLVLVNHTYVVGVADTVFQVLCYDSSLSVSPPWGHIEQPAGQLGMLDTEG